MTVPHDLPGVSIDRRSVLALPLLAAPAAILPRRAARSGDDEGELAFEAFAGACERLAGAHLRGGRVNADALLHALGGLGARLDAGDVPRPELRPFGGYDPPVAIAPVHRALPVMVIEWRLAPGAVLPAHNHTPGYVLSLCLEGSCRVRHFEIAGDAPAPGAEGGFRLRATHARLLRPGLGTTLTPERDNVHTFTAGPSGALGIDVNVFLPGDGDWSMIDVSPRDRDGDGFDELHDARWTGKPGA